MSIRAICVAISATGLLSMLTACAPAPAPVCPAAALVRPPGTPPPTVAVPAPVPAPAVTLPPVSGNTVPPEAEPASAPPRSAEPADMEPDFAARAPRSRAAERSPNAFSGSSTPTPQAGRAAARRPPREIPARARPEFDLDEDQLQAQWINPPVYAGE